MGNKERWLQLGKRALKIGAVAGVIGTAGGCASGPEVRRGEIPGNAEPGKSTLVVNKAEETPFAPPASKEVTRDIVEYGADRIPQDIAKELAKKGEKAERVIDVALVSPDGQRVGFSFVDTGTMDYVAFRDAGGSVSISDYARNTEVSTATGQVFVGFRTVGEAMGGRLFMEFGMDLTILRLPGETETEFVDRVNPKLMAEMVAETDEAYKKGEKVLTVKIVNPTISDGNWGTQEIVVSSKDLVTRILELMPHGSAEAEEVPPVSQMKARVVTPTPGVTATVTATRGVTATATGIPRAEATATRTVEPVATPGGEVITGGLNLRSEPDGTIVGGLKFGDTFRIDGISSNGAWYKISVNGKEFYVSSNASLVKSNVDRNDLSVFEMPRATATVVAPATRVPEKAPVISNSETAGYKSAELRAIVDKEFQGTLLGKTFTINLRNPKYPETVFHPVVKFFKVTQFVGYGQALDGTKKTRKYLATDGTKVYTLSLADDSASDDWRGSVDPSSRGTLVWDSELRGQSGETMMTVLNYTFKTVGGPVLPDVELGNVYGFFIEDNNKDYVEKSHITALKAIQP